MGCGGTTPSPLLELLAVANAMASSLRLGAGAVASATRPTPLADHPPNPDGQEDARRPSPGDPSPRSRGRSGRLQPPARSKWRSCRRYASRPNPAHDPVSHRRGGEGGPAVSSGPTRGATGPGALAPSGGRKAPGGSRVSGGFLPRDHRPPRTWSGSGDGEWRCPPSREHPFLPRGHPKRPGVGGGDPLRVEALRQ